MRLFYHVTAKLFHKPRQTNMSIESADGTLCTSYDSVRNAFAKHFNSLLDGIKLDDNLDGTEYLFTCDSHIWSDIRKHGGLNEKTLRTMPFATRLQLCTFVNACLDILENSVKLLL